MTEIFRNFEIFGNFWDNFQALPEQFLGLVPGPPRGVKFQIREILRNFAKTAIFAKSSSPNGNFENLPLLLLFKAGIFCRAGFRAILDHPINLISSINWRRRPFISLMNFLDLGLYRASFRKVSLKLCAVIQ